MPTVSCRPTECSRQIFQKRVSLSVSNKSGKKPKKSVVRVRHDETPELPPVAYQFDALDCVPRGDPRNARHSARLLPRPIFVYRATQAALPYTGIGLSGHLGRSSGRPWALASPLGLASALGRFEPLDVGYTAQLVGSRTPGGGRTTRSSVRGRGSGSRAAPPPISNE